MELPSWFDEEFFKLGCFCSLPDNQGFVFAKGGSWTQLPTSGPLHFQLRDFYQRERWYYQPAGHLVLTSEEIEKQFIDDHTKINLQPLANEDHHFLQDFDQLQNTWSDHLQKVVLTSRTSYQIDDPLTIRKKSMLRSLKAKTGYAYGFWKDDYGMIGVTPEILFELKNSHLQTMALAGTAPKDQGQELLNSKKDREEHELVVRNLEEDLKDLTESFSKGKMELHPYGRLVHLLTRIEARLRPGIRVEDLMDRLSPTAALGGYPRTEALQFLKNTHYYRAHPHRYHGSVFCVNYHQSSRALVMIRNIQLHQNTLILEAGAGILPLSQKDKELKEIHQKQLSIQELLL